MPVATSNFLLPNATIIPEFLAFMVVLGVLAKYVVPPINRTMEARRQSIAEALKVIDEAKVRQAEAEQRAHAVLEEARQTARTTIDNANRLAEQVQAEARRAGEEEYARLVGRAQAEIDRQRQQAEAELVSRMADLVVATAERVVQAEIDSDRHAALIDEAIAAVTTAPAASGAGR